MMRAMIAIMLMLALLPISAAAQSSPGAAPVVEQGPLRVALWPDRWTTTPVDSITLTFQTEVEPGWAVESPMADIAVGDTLSGMTVESITPQLVERLANGRLRTTRVYTLAPDLPGPATLGPYRVTARKAGTAESVQVRTTPVELSVTSLLAEAGDAFTPGAIRAPLGPEPANVVPGELSALAIGIGSGLVVVIAGGAIVLWRVRKRLADSPAARMAQLRAEIDELASTDIDSRAAALAADALARRALALSVLPGAQAMTSQEIVAQMRSWQAYTTLQAALASALEGVERVVFAGDSDIGAEEILDRARRVIDAAPVASTNGEAAA